ncbi:MAG: hypothetical protein JWO37_1644 [Acidimicrobiales bacterium]|jgi:8-oxo-dGTP pyrophosphatase MutT (NUDIX family)|nr:hypothetical protein [Acidimicrobiales bacterium]
MAIRRQAARVVLLDDDGRVFLQHAKDPMDHTKDPWWELPGGGIHHGETTGDAAGRELYEETGIKDFEMGPVVWKRHTTFTFGGWHFDQDELIHVAWLRGPAVYQPTGLEMLEAAAFLEPRWWTVDELLVSTVQLWPSRMRDHLPSLVAGEMPAEPIDVGH